MLQDTVKQLFKRDLNKLKQEIEVYQNEDRLWDVEEGISNSAGNLCLHLIGNLNHFVGAVIGKTDYVRNRPLEFSMKNVPRAELITKIDETIHVIEMALNQLPDAALKEDYPLMVFENKTSTEYFLVHLTTHLSYHLGQINYHRRLLDK